MIRPIANQQDSKRTVIKANAQYSFPFIGSFVAILSTTGTVDVLVSLDNGTPTKLRAGASIDAVRLTKDGASLEPAIFRRVTIENTLDVPITVEYMVSLGKSNIPLVINDTVRVEGAGVPVGRDSIAAVIGGVTAQVSAAAKAVTIQPETNGVIIEAGGKRIANVADGDFMTFPWTNVELTLKGDGGTSTVYLAEVQ